MKKDIEIPKVDGVYVAVVKEWNNEGDLIWNVYLVNDKEKPLKNTFVSSKGYLKEVNGTESKTSTLRHYFKEIPPKISIKIEPIMPDLFKLNIFESGEVLLRMHLIRHNIKSVLTEKIPAAIIKKIYL